MREDQYSVPGLFPFVVSLLLLYPDLSTMMTSKISLLVIAVALYVHVVGEHQATTNESNFLYHEDHFLLISMSYYAVTMIFVKH